MKVPEGSQNDTAWFHGASAQHGEAVPPLRPGAGGGFHTGVRSSFWSTRRMSSIRLNSAEKNVRRFSFQAGDGRESQQLRRATSSWSL